MRAKLLICDLDNTLYDWVGFFVPAFYAMVDEAVRILACDREVLLDELKLVHQHYQDAEHPFALLETGTVAHVMRHLDVEERRRTLDPAFRAFNTVRKDRLKLYPGVEDTLERLKQDGVALVAHSESKLYSVVFRLRFLDLTKYFEKIYCLERPPRTLGDQSRIKSFWADFPTSRIVELTHHQRKPSPEVLGEIIKTFDLEAREAAYIGDSIAKDVYMAKQVGSIAIWAEYGSKHPPDEYAKLVRISHWTPAEIRYEAELRKLTHAVRPDFVAKSSFAELLKFIA